MPFWICAADANGDRIIGAEEMLSPGPAELEYPTDPAGVVVDTPDGKLIKQQPSHDPRRRAWVWHNLPSYIRRYERLIVRLEQLLARTRREQGLSPYVYLRDTESLAFRRWVYQTGTFTAVGANTATDSTKNWDVDAYTQGVVEVLDGTGAGQARAIRTNTATQLTLDQPWTTQPTGATYRLQASVSDWVRVRVLEVSKRVSGKAGLWFDPVRVVFVVDDASWNDVG